VLPASFFRGASIGVIGADFCGQWESRFLRLAVSLTFFELFDILPIIGFARLKKTRPG
jgi:hypothetical protein